MKKIETKSLKGNAKVQVAKNKMRIIFASDPSKPVVVETPAWFPPAFKSGELYVKLGKDNEILSASPLHGMFTGKFKKFFSMDGAIPEPRPVEARAGTSSKGKPYKIDAHLEFSAITKISDPADFAGMTVTDNMFYLFSDDGGETALKGGGKSFEHVEGFLEATGADKAVIPYSENVLPKLQKVILTAGKSYRFMVENGFVTRYIALDDVEDEEEWAADDEDEDKPASKPVPAEDDSSWGEVEEDDDTVSDSDATETDEPPF